MHHHRYPNRCLIGHPLVDKTVLTEHKAVVTHVDDQRLIVDPHGLQLVYHFADAFIDCQERLTVAFVVLLYVQLTVIGKVHPMPAVALVCQPARSMFGLLWFEVLTGGPLPGGIGKATGVTFGGRKVGMHGLVREVQEEGFGSGHLFLEPGQGIVGQLVGDVALLLDPLPIDIECVVGPRW